MFLCFYSASEITEPLTPNWPLRCADQLPYLPPPPSNYRVPRLPLLLPKISGPGPGLLPHLSWTESPPPLLLTPQPPRSPPLFPPPSGQRNPWTWSRPAAHEDLSVPTALRGDAGSSRGPTARTIGSQGLLGSSSCALLPRTHPRVLARRSRPPRSAIRPPPPPSPPPRPSLRPRPMAQTLQSCGLGTDLRTRVLAGSLGRSGRACSVLVLGARVALVPKMSRESVDKLAGMNRAESLSVTQSTPRHPRPQTQVRWLKQSLTPAQVSECWL